MVEVEIPEPPAPEPQAEPAAEEPTAEAPAEEAKTPSEEVAAPPTEEPAEANSTVEASTSTEVNPPADAEKGGQKQSEEITADGEITEEEDKDKEKKDEVSRDPQSGSWSLTDDTTVKTEWQMQSFELTPIKKISATQKMNYVSRSTGSSNKRKPGKDISSTEKDFAVRYVDQEGVEREAHVKIASRKNVTEKYVSDSKKEYFGKELRVLIITTEKGNVVVEKHISHNGSLPNDVRTMVNGAKWEPTETE
jgi:hypothetical protein